MGSLPAGQGRRRLRGERHHPPGRRRARRGHHRQRPVASPTATRSPISLPANQRRPKPSLRRRDRSAAAFGVAEPSSRGVPGGEPIANALISTANQAFVDGTPLGCRRRRRSNSLRRVWSLGSWLPARRSPRRRGRARHTSTKRSGTSMPVRLGRPRSSTADRGDPRRRPRAARGRGLRRVDDRSCRRPGGCGQVDDLPPVQGQSRTVASPPSSARLLRRPIAPDTGSVRQRPVRAGPQPASYPDHDRRGRTLPATLAATARHPGWRKRIASS